MRGGDGSAATRRLAGDRLLRLVVEGSEVLCVLAVLWTLARALGGLVLQERAVGAQRAGRVVAQLERAGAQHESEQMRGHRTPDRVGLGERPRRVAVGEGEHADVIARVDV